MMPGDLILAIDIGTSSCKVCLFDSRGEILTITKKEYPTHSPQPTYAEQDAGVIYSGIVEAVCEAIEGYQITAITAITFDTMMHSTFFIDRDGNPLAPLLNWMDTRSMAEVEELREEYRSQNFYFHSGVPLHTIYTLPRLRWFQKNIPGVLDSAWKIVTIKDWILGKITGEWFCDYSTASGTGLLNLSRLNWDDDLLSLVHCSSDKFLPLCEPEYCSHLMKGDFSKATGLLPGIPVIWGGGDGPYANLGEGMFHPGEMVVTVGSSGAVRMCDRKPVFDPNGRSWCYYLADGIWVGGGAINNGGIVYSWMNELLKDDDQWEIDLHRQRPLFLPFLTGERSPNWNAHARGILFGLSYFHNREGLMQSVYEGIAFRVRSIYKMMQDVIGNPTQTVINGGFGISPKGSLVLCNVLGIPVQLSNYPSAPGKGAFLLALKSQGVIQTFDDLSVDYFPERPFLQPISEHTEFYEKLYCFYEKVYRANEGLFKEFTDFHLG